MHQVVAKVKLTYDSNWKWPQIPDLQDFKGELIHSADWPENFVYSGKKVAIIGNGSSGVQIVPTLQPGELPDDVLRRIIEN
jgi:cation diffusion facilitator CzcD-associated flavoprotein CzcO